ncbi:uncharacterized protein BX663DRAFT_491934 [Cokeromyces recurvatus]|uniref:uncharacterized protein n=1 Tax=Cokeromyces recurvatus TaxID=90255 RepID=UPI002220561C|nr:uncharacterized protein BX663DRAFT_491934 [Cokeromyces recurvatus]KAI7907755.1 hypothetical protein BX663DRAFT_491934 [Cokeromyces recurvatus]
MNHDEESPLIPRNDNQSNGSWRQKFQRITHKHRFRIIISWLIILSITAVLTLSLHFTLKDKEMPHVSDNNENLNEMCVSDRSWFVALMLSIFFGPLGIDRFYLGYIFLGIIKLLTAGLGGVWWTVDVILIALNVLNDHPHGCHLR